MNICEGDMDFHVSKIYSRYKRKIRREHIKRKYKTILP